MSMPPIYDARDPSFSRLVFGNSQLERLWTGARWAEGPVYHPAGKFLLFSDIPNDRVMRYDETDGSVSVFESPCLNSNGHYLDQQGRILRCEHRGRAVSRIGHDGVREVLADSFDGKRLNSPNDVCVHPDGAIWFSDPSYGIDTDYEGDAAESQIGAAHVYRIPPQGGPARAMVTDMVRPNGLAFSPDGRTLYVVDTGITHVLDCRPKIRAYPVPATASRLGEGADFAYCDNGMFDGIRCDTEGRIWAAAGDGVHCYRSDGMLLGKILVPEVCANLCFGGVKRNRMFICGTTSLYAIYVNARGLDLIRRG